MQQVVLGLGIVLLVALIVTTSAKPNDVRGTRKEKHNLKKKAATINRQSHSSEDEKDEEEKASKRERRAKEEDVIINNNAEGSRFRNALTSDSDSWYNPGVIGTQTIYYRLAFSNEPVKTKLETAMRILEAYAADFNNVNCFQFVNDEWASQTEFFTVVYDSGVSGCSANVGKTGGSTLRLGAYCATQNGMLLHELLHVLGLGHEHIRPDRDTYIDVNYNNIQAGATVNFQKYSWLGRVFDTNYDYCSIMHYNPYLFAIDYNIKTISPKQYTVPPCPGGGGIGQRVQPTDTDIYKVQRLYQCTVTKTPCPPPEPQKVIYCPFESHNDWPWDNCDFKASGSAAIIHQSAQSAGSLDPFAEMTFWGTEGKGKYLKADVANSFNGSVGLYTSPVLSAGDYCIQYEFFMENTLSPLKVYTVLAADGVTRGVTQSVTYDPNAECYGGSGPLKEIYDWLSIDYCDNSIKKISEPNDFKVVFEVDVNKASSQNVILDEVIIRQKDPDVDCEWQWLTIDELNMVCPGSVAIVDVQCPGCIDDSWYCTPQCLQAIAASC
ncbi:unnamed protein product [Owenia fusiformis]|uniref:Metalloendopeptidase n=1 Tax=Owenia fusiformis TaxID=6347 RepID=A0A8J1Y7Y3_OWEFU|nr:unnamed protein product [Owenia fusiformis]